MTGEWWTLYGLMIVSLGSNYWLLHKLRRANNLIQSLQTIIRGMHRRNNENR